MPTKRSERIGELILEYVSQLLIRQINDPRIGDVTLTGAEVSRNLRHARIYFSILAEKEPRGEVLNGLRSATGFIRSKIARELALRFVPEIEFVYDNTQEKAQRIEQLLRQVKDDK
ncbi:MAG: 30S ribosome-binding factor RbfA [Deltaproteobacteria bacterium]|nr:30S ribosome-binding factor RbfA [Deltaproteobacteria bacterium]